ncbi:MAG: histidinol-phosphatase [Clostridia bacterium]
MIDYHIHLERGEYNSDWLEKFIKVGYQRGIEEFGIVEHLYIFKGTESLLYQNDHVKFMQTKNLDEYFSFLEKMKQKHNIKIGLEIDYVEEFEEKIKEFVKDLPVDFLIGSVHYIDGWAFDLDKDWANRNVREVYNKYYKTLLKAAKSGIFDILGHPGNISYFGHKPNWDFEKPLVESFYQDISNVDIVLEINSGGLYRPAKEVFPKKIWFERLKELEIEVTCSSDAHDPKNVGWVINKEIIPALKSSGFNQLVTFDSRKKGYKAI